MPSSHDETTFQGMDCDFEVEKDFWRKLKSIVELHVYIQVLFSFFLSFLLLSLQNHSQI